MNIGTIPGHTHVLGAPAEWNQAAGTCEGLPVLQVETPHGPALVSDWVPTDEERQRIAQGGTVQLWVWGPHPVVALGVRPSQIDEGEGM